MENWIIFPLRDYFLFKKEEERKVKSQTVLLPLSVGVEKDYGMFCSQQIHFDLVWMFHTWPKAHNVCVHITIDPNFRAVPLKGFCSFGERPGLTFPAVPVSSVPEMSSTPAVTTSPQSTAPLALALLTALGFFPDKAP